MAMTLKKAVGLAMKSMQKELQRFAFDASMYRDYGIENFECGKRAARRVEELKEAQGVLLALVNGDTFPIGSKLVTAESEGTAGDGEPVIWMTEGNTTSLEPVDLEGLMKGTAEGSYGGG